MPWKECQKMDERLRFVSRHLEGECISELCREFGISRVTGHKLVDRYKQHGIEALSDRSKRPYRMANGVPFASAHALHGLSRLAVWWLRLGIEIERIKPGNPQQNGRHERMHRVLKQATARPPASNMLQQQDKFERFIQEYNYERPHEGIQMKTPASLYQPSDRLYKGLPELSYPFHDRTLLITECGRICLDHRKISVSTVLGGQKVGIKQVDDQIWQVSFMDYDLGYFDMDSCCLEPGPNPFGPRLLTM